MRRGATPLRYISSCINSCNITWSIATTKYIYMHQTRVTLVAGGPDGTFLTGLGAGKTQQRCIAWLSLSVSVDRIVLGVRHSFEEKKRVIDDDSYCVAPQRRPHVCCPYGTFTPPTRRGAALHFIRRAYSATRITKRERGTPQCTPRSLLSTNYSFESN